MHNRGLVGNVFICVHALPFDMCSCSNETKFHGFDAHILTWDLYLYPSHTLCKEHIQLNT